MFTRWTKELGRLSPSTSRLYQCNVRSFLLFHARDHANTFIPDRLTFPKSLPAVVPRLISELEMGRRLAAAIQLHATPHHPLREYPTRVASTPIGRVYTIHKKIVPKRSRECQRWGSGRTNSNLIFRELKRDLYQKIRPLLLHPPDPPRRRTAFHPDN